MMILSGDPPRGRLLAIYIVGYGVGRLWIELLRVDPAGHLLGVRVNVWVSLLAIVAGTAWLLMPRRPLVPIDTGLPAELGDEDDLEVEPEADTEVSE